MLEDLALPIPALPHPTLADIQGRWPGVRKINFDNSPEGATSLSLGTFLRKDEPSINGAEYERRRKSLSGLHGFQQGLWLEKNQDHPDLAAFRSLRKQVYIDLPGIEVVSAVGNRDFPYLIGDGERWRLNLYWTGRDLYRNGRVGRSRT